ncbi:MAG: threonine aldolase [Verrucomicrobia bacterium]|nr:MAG: threonine aldolase [Verrucomicrobiota bacterium]
METRRRRDDFASDNTAPICPEARVMLEEANTGNAPSYGDDRRTRRVGELVRELFERDCAVYLVFNGTAANALALAQLCQSHHAVICHQHAHLQTDECGAPEFFTKGAKLLLAGGADGKIDMELAAKLFDQQPELHAQQPRALSLTQSTELGTVYTADEIRVLADFAHQRSCFLHMDGARFANAIAALGCAPKLITWQSGVDVLCFGGTKNGLAAGELVIFFEKKLARDFEYRLKQAGQLGSKMRFLAAPWIGLLTGDVWLRNARHANHMAAHLAERLRAEARIDIIFPVEANTVFVRLSQRCAQALRERGWDFYSFIEPDVYRLMCSWCTSEKTIAEFVADVAAANA